ncbi:hypothetical protein N9805_05135 [Paracoccaceae bacterium]|nr:hypothetical protein [Paracoccaceae bacterium]
MNSKIKILTTDDYPAPRPLFLKARGKYMVSVSIPRAISHLFKNHGDRRLTAGKTIEDYERVKRSKTNQIYAEFDKVQEEALLKRTEGKVKRVKTQQGLEDFDAEARINTMMNQFPSVISRAIKNDIILEDESFALLNTKIPYQSLLKLKNNMDNMANMVLEAHPEGEDLKEAQDYFWKHNVINDGKQIIEPNEEGYKDWDGYEYSVYKRIACEGYLQPEVRSFLEDLLVNTAVKQKIEIPVFNESHPDDFWSVKNIDGISLGWFDGSGWSSARQRRTSAITFSSVRDDYLAWCLEHRKDKGKSTQNKLRLGIDEFIMYMGDLELGKLDDAMAIEFAEAQIANNPKRSRQVVLDRSWAMSHFCERYGKTKRLMKSNPFKGAGVGIYGKKAKHWFEYSDTDLDKIFSYDWAEQERLLLELALCTGMRLNEIACLTWERLKRTNRYTYITLKDGFYLPTQSVKNIGSKRDIPLHPVFTMPTTGKGRIFNYSISGYGNATTSAGKKINPILNKIIPDPQKTFHSFRSTFIIKLNESGCPPFTNKSIVGHGSNNANEALYSGITNDARFEEIRKLDLKPWLNRMPNR